LVTKEKRKKKKQTKKLQQATESQTQGKEQDLLKKTSLGPLRQGQRLDTTKTKNQAQEKSKRPPNQSSKTTTDLPYTHASSP
jgi:hypothetical protein